MTALRMLRFLGKASLQLLKTAVSFATGTVATVCVFLGLAFLPRIPKTPLLAGRFAVRSLILAAFMCGFYLTFRLLEPRMATRKKWLVASLGIVLPLASLFVLSYKPALGITGFSQKASPPGPPKPYDEAIYDVYSGLLDEERTQRSLWDKFTNPIPEGVLIRIETTIDTGRDWPYRPASLQGNIMPQEQLDKAVSSATADYARRSRESLQLQRKVNLPQYDLITTTEEQAVLKDEGHDQESSGCAVFARKHPNYYRWVELSAVGFNEDQTVAYLYMAEWRGSSPLCQRGIFGHGGYRILYKQNGKWRLVEPQRFADWVT